MLYLVFLLALVSQLFAQPFQWTSFTSTSNVAGLESLDGQIWCATSGGLSHYNPQTQLFDNYTNTRGLAMNKCEVVGKDSYGWIWACLADARITRVDPQSGATRQIVDLEREVFEITDIIDYQSQVFISANNGIFRLFYSDIDQNYHVLEPIQVLGSFLGDTRVARLAIYGDHIYAATAVGLARANLNQQYLNPPAAWENYTTGSSNLPENNLIALYTSSDNLLWLASPTRVFSFDGSNFQSVAMLSNIKQFAEVNGQMYAATANQIYRLENGTWNSFGTPLSQISALLSFETNDSQELIVGIADNSTERGGLVFYNNNQWSSPVRSQGLAGNSISALAVDNHGKLWAGATAPGGVFTFENDQWVNYINDSAHPQSFYLSSVTGIAFDDYNGAWISTYGGGAAWFHDETITYFNYTDTGGFDTNGPRLVGVSEGPAFVVCGVGRNTRGDIYLTNLRSIRNLPLVRVSREWISQGNHQEPWNYYFQGGAIVESKLQVIDVIADPQNRIWIGSVYDQFQSWVLNDRATPADTTDDQWFGYLPSTYQDNAFTCFDNINGIINDWEIDQQGYLWTATMNGAYYTQAGIPDNLNNLHFICVPDLPVGNQVNDIHVDAQDNKWFATDGGVAVLDKNFNWIHKFRTANSPDDRSDLISNNVLAITSNPITGEVWLGTADGLSRLQSPYLSRGGELSDLWPYPNPFKSDGNQRMFIDHRKLGGRFDDFRIYTISGRLVRKLSWSDMIDPAGGWDGKNADGEAVAGGVYLLVATSNDGKSVTGKVAVTGQ